MQLQKVFPSTNENVEPTHRLMHTWVGNEENERKGTCYYLRLFSLFLPTNEWKKNINGLPISLTLHRETNKKMGISYDVQCLLDQ